MIFVGILAILFVFDLILKRCWGSFYYGTKVVIIYTAYGTGKWISRVIRQIGDKMKIFLWSLKDKDMWFF